MITYSAEDSEEDLQNNIEDLKDWFFDNYEDPAEHTSYNGREGGYLYIHGGPYDAYEELVKYWDGEYPDDIISATSSAIEAIGISEWAPAQWRVAEDSGLDSPPEHKFSITAGEYQELLQKAEKLEKALDGIHLPINLIGHNNPPEPADFPITEEDESYIRDVIAKIKQSTYKTLILSYDVIIKFAKLAKVVLHYSAKYAAKQADISLTEANKSFSATAGKYMAHAVFGIGGLHLLGIALEETANFMKSFFHLGN